MGLSHDKIFRLILFTAILLTTPLLRADSDSGVAATLQNLTLPNYKGNKLQFVLYGERAVNLGATITIYNPLIDIVSRNIPDVEVITLLNNVKSPDPNVSKIEKIDPKRLYPLYTDHALVREFWKGVPHAQVLIASTNAVYDKNKKTLTGDNTVHFRSRDLDIDGVGFDANQKTKFIHVRRNVSVVFRPDVKLLKDDAERLLSEKYLVLLSSKVTLENAKKCLKNNEIVDYKIGNTGIIQAVFRDKENGSFKVQVHGFPSGDCKAQCSCAENSPMCRHAVAACLYRDILKQKNREQRRAVKTPEETKNNKIKKGN